MAVRNSSLNISKSNRETSDSSSASEPSFEQTDSPTCIYCKSKNTNHPLCGYCEECLKTCSRCKVRKTFKYFMFCVSCNKSRKNFCASRPKPKKLKKSRNIEKENSDMRVRLGARRELNKEKQIVVVDSVEESRTTGQDVEISKIVDTGVHCNPQHGRKRHLSESNLPDFAKKPSSSKTTMEVLPTEMSCLRSGINSSGSSFIEQVTTQLDDSELCIICNDAPKNGVFLHEKVAHLFCCYSCAMRAWRVNKRCPVCNCTIYNVLKLFKT